MRVEKLYKSFATFKTQVAKVYKAAGTFDMTTTTLCMTRINIKMQTTKLQEQTTSKLMARIDYKTWTAIL